MRTRASALPASVDRQRFFNQTFLLLHVDRVIDSGGTCRRRAADIARSFTLWQKIFQTRFHEGPATHTLGLFLTPDKLLCVRITDERFLQSLLWKRIELFETNQRDAIIPVR